MHFGKAHRSRCWLTSNLIVSYYVTMEPEEIWISQSLPLPYVALRCQYIVECLLVSFLDLGLKINLFVNQP